MIANGEWDTEWGKDELSPFDLLIAADGGGNRVLESGLPPHVLIGDLDSIHPENLEKCRYQGTLIHQYPREKDETDLELALEYAVAQLSKNEALQTRRSSPDIQDVQEEQFGKAQHPLKDIYLFGATGGRVDHLLGNLALMLGYFKKGYRIRVKDPYHELWLIGGAEKIRGQKDQEISLIPISESAVVRTEGLYYPLNHETLKQDSPRGISNVFLGENALIDVSDGIVLAVLLNPNKIR